MHGDAQVFTGLWLINFFALAKQDGQAYMHDNSGASASTPKAPPDHTTGPLARFFVPETQARCHERPDRKDEY